MTPVASLPAAGRELDTLIAEKVMGWTVNRADGGHWHTVGPTGRERGILVGRNCCADKYDGAFCPSTNISDAWEVVEKLRTSDHYVDICSLVDTPGLAWRAEIRGLRSMWEPVVAVAETAPLAICLAALEAVGAALKAVAP